MDWEHSAKAFMIDMISMIRFTFEPCSFTYDKQDPAISTLKSTVQRLNKAKNSHITFW